MKNQVDYSYRYSSDETIESMKKRIDPTKGRITDYEIALNVDNRYSVDMLLTALNEGINGLKIGQSVVTLLNFVPIDEDGNLIEVGTHWVDLIAKRTNQGIDFYYIDAAGDEISPEFSNLLKRNFRNCAVESNRIRYQGMGGGKITNDCGPLLSVMTADYINKGKIDSNYDLKRIREEDHRLFNNLPELPNQQLQPNKKTNILSSLLSSVVTIFKYILSFIPTSLFANNTNNVINGNNQVPNQAANNGQIGIAAADDFQQTNFRDLVIPQRIKQKYDPLISNIDKVLKKHNCDDQLNFVVRSVVDIAFHDDNGIDFGTIFNKLSAYGISRNEIEKELFELKGELDFDKVSGNKEKALQYLEQRTAKQKQL